MVSTMNRELKFNPLAFGLLAVASFLPDTAMQGLWYVHRNHLLPYSLRPWLADFLNTPFFGGILFGFFFSVFAIPALSKVRTLGAMEVITCTLVCGVAQILSMVAVQLCSPFLARLGISALTAVTLLTAIGYAAVLRTAFKLEFSLAGFAAVATVGVLVPYLSYIPGLPINLGAYWTFWVGLMISFLAAREAW